MDFVESLTNGILIKRYRRFLADILLADGSIITAHCPNTGTMLSCSIPDSPVCLSRSVNPTRKYPFTLEMIKIGMTWVGVNTGRTNALVVEAIEKGQITELGAFDEIKKEVKVTDHTRLDLQIMHKDCGSTFLEIKTCSLAIDGCAMFPDAVTARGTRHLQELARLSRAGFGAGIFFLVQRMDADRFAPAADIDPIYSKALGEAIAAGVRVFVYQALVSPTGIQVVRPLPYSLPNLSKLPCSSCFDGAVLVTARCE